MASLRNEFLAVVQHVDGKYQAACPEIPEARSEGHSKLIALETLRDEIERIIESRRDRAIKLSPDDAVIEMIIL